MAGYKYNLQKVLELKENIEDEKKNELAVALKRLENEKEKLEILKEKMQQEEAGFQETTTEGIPVNQLKMIIDNIEYYKRNIKKQKLAIKMAQEYSDQCRMQLVRATQEKKMMEKLKEIDFKEYLYEEQKKEERLVDDLVTFKESSKK